MVKKYRGNIAFIIIYIICIAIVSVYHYLQMNSYYTRDIYYWFRKVFQKEIPVDDILYDRRLQYVLISLMYVTLFCLVMRLIKTSIVKKIIAVVLSVIYTIHMFLDDTIINYFRFFDRYHRLSKLSFSEFSISKIWSDSISRYGLLIVLINLGFMCALLFSIIMFKTKLVEGNSGDDDWILDEDDDIVFGNSDLAQKRRRAHSILMNYQENDVGAVRVVELYINDAIGYKAVLDYIDSLPVNDVNGLKSLKLIECTIAELHPVIEAAVRKAKNTKYRKMIETNDSLEKLLPEKKGGKIVRFTTGKKDDESDDN